jgi:chemotaxis protein MotB
MARQKKSGGDGGPSGNEWLATFSDTMTLLLTFFILLYSFSTVDSNKLKQISSAFYSILTGQQGNSAFDFNMKYGEVPIIGENTEQTIVPIEKGTGEVSMLQKVLEFVEKNNLEAVVQIKADSRGIIIQLRDNILFESGSASLKENSKAILEKINGLIATFPNNIIVEGHTDNVPISNYKYESNWELSTARAVSVLRFFVEAKGQSPMRFTAAGYGEYRPVEPNNSESGRAANRRVNILIVANEEEKK